MTERWENWFFVSADLEWYAHLWIIAPDFYAAWAEEELDQEATLEAGDSYEP